jgi:hypothetical protein
MPKSEKPFDLDAEIADLEVQLAKKKQALEAIRAPAVPEAHEKELLGAMLKERIHGIEKMALETPQPAVSSQTGQSDVSQSVASAATPQTRELQEKAHAQQVEVLVEVALAKGIPEAVELARQLNNPHILDDFHDALVDEYYEKLVARRA